MKIKTVTLDVRLSENTKRSIRWVLLPVAVLAGSMAVARAYTTTWVASGQPMSATNLKSNLDEIQSRLVAIEGASAVKVEAAATVSVSAGVFVNLPLSTVDWDVLGEYSSTNGFTPVNTGVYQFCASVVWGAAFTGENELDFALSGSPGTVLCHTTDQVCVGCADVHLNAGQHGTVSAYQSSTSTQTILVSSRFTYISVHRVY